MLPKFDQTKPLAIPISVLIVFIIAFFAVQTVKVYKEIRYVGTPETFERQISIEGTGKVMAFPDIATITVGIDTKGKEVATAQKENSEKNNALIASLKKLGVAEEDIKTTSYNVYENQEYNPEVRKYDSLGWMVSQRLEIKIRKMDQLSKVLEAAGQGGANSISGPSFTIDDMTTIKDEAREKAIADANKKAEILADKLDVRLGNITSYNEYMQNDRPVYYETMSMKGVDDSMDMAAPEIQTGQNEYAITINITYELK
ncbi:MAG: SIMPL domain-containing protein [Candidatus Peregrinibacteria bacterium]|nr:SIMPL domain-containing protein [Candidatus Peregrinibacteria bacterium]MDZ4245264.1 SIMPL domain-containing protein [Candidatus Gracilibacteria bacterium]